MAIIAAQPFCDYISVSTPRDRYESVSAALLEVVRACGGYDERQGVVQLGQRGVFAHRVKHNLGLYALSGDALAEMRRNRFAFDWFGEWLTLVGEGAHNVTRLDVAVDLVVDSAAVVGRMYKRGRSGRVSITRKAIAPAQVRRIFEPSVYGGADTGTVYLGERGKRDVIARVYDKRQELLKKLRAQYGDALTPEFVALNDPGPLCRFELELGRKVGVTLRDAYEPAAVFWHFARESLLPKIAPAVAEWSPHGAGFTVPRSEPDHAKQLSFLLEASHDIKRAVTLADRLGPYGRDHLCRLLKAMGSILAPAVPNRLPSAAINTPSASG